MPAAAAVLYRESFLRRTAAMARDGWTTIDEAGICGVYGPAGQSGGRVLVSDDRAAPSLESVLDAFHPEVVNVFADAPHCRETIEAAGRWSGEPATAMVCRDLATLPPAPTPEGLEIRVVRRVFDDPVGGVGLESAARTCLRADPMSSVPIPGFLTFLRALPGRTRLLAAVDRDGEVRATSGCSVFGEDASAYFVSTDAEWRGRGVATFMTSAALTWAHESGARRASLDASPSGLAIYRRLGFEPVSATTLFARFG